MNRYHLVIGAAGALATAAPCYSWQFRCRFVERVGNVDTLLTGDTIDASSGASRTIRIQFGVFDDEELAAPMGGFVGWNVGSIAVGGPADNSDERRTNGRLAPFNFGPGPNANGNPPLPGGDPFTMLTEIDNTLGTQSPIWTCGADGIPQPMPSAIVRGRNTYVSTYAFSIDPRPGARTYSVVFAGNLIAASEWRTIGNPAPPVCNPEDPSCDLDGAVTYAPFPTPPQAFSCELTVVVPAPPSALLTGPAMVFARRRVRAGARSNVHAPESGS